MPRFTFSFSLFAAATAIDGSLGSMVCTYRYTQSWKNNGVCVCVCVTRARGSKFKGLLLRRRQQQQLLLLHHLCYTGIYGDGLWRRGKVALHFKTTSSFFSRWQNIARGYAKRIV